MAIKQLEMSEVGPDRWHVVSHPSGYLSTFTHFLNQAVLAFFKGLAKQHTVAKSLRQAIGQHSMAWNPKCFHSQQPRGDADDGHVDLSPSALPCIARATTEEVVERFGVGDVSSSALIHNAHCSHIFFFFLGEPNHHERLIVAEPRPIKDVGGEVQISCHRARIHSTSAKASSMAKASEPKVALTTLFSL